MKIRHVDQMHLRGIKIEHTARYSDLSLIARMANIHDRQHIETLDTLSIGCLCDISKASLPSEIVDLIISDLKLHCMTQSDRAALWFLWRPALDMIMEQFAAYDHVSILSRYDALWTKACSVVKIDPNISLIDQIAQRMHLTWTQAAALSWAECVQMLRIDLRTRVLDSMIQQQNESK